MKKMPATKYRRELGRRFFSSAVLPSLVYPSFPGFPACQEFLIFTRRGSRCGGALFGENLDAADKRGKRR